MTLHDDGTNLHVQLPSGRKVAWTLHDSLDPTGDDIHEYLQSARAANGGISTFKWKGKVYSLPDSPESFDRLPDNHRNAINEAFSVHGLYNHADARISTTHEVANDHTIGGEEVFHALAKELKGAGSDTYNRMLTARDRVTKKPLYANEDEAYQAFLKGKSRANYFERIRKGTAHWTPSDHNANQRLSPKERAANDLISAAQSEGVLMSDHDFETFKNDAGGLHPDVLDGHFLLDKDGKKQLREGVDPRAKHTWRDYRLDHDGNKLRPLISEDGFSNVMADMGPAASDSYQQRIIDELLMTKEEKLQKIAEHYEHPNSDPDLQKAAALILGKEPPQFAETAGEDEEVPFAVRKNSDQLRLGDQSDRATVGDTKEMFGDEERTAPKESEASKPIRFETGKKLTPEQRKEVLRSVGDSYRDLKAPKIFKGENYDGDPIYGYGYNPEFMHASDITGRKIRNYIKLPDGKIAHPSELYPDITQSDIDRAVAEEQNRIKQQEYTAKEKDRRAASNKQDANMKYNITGRDTIGSYFAQNNEGKIVRVDGKDAADVKHFEDRGFKPISTPVQPVGDIPESKNAQSPPLKYNLSPRDMQTASAYDSNQPTPEFAAGVRDYIAGKSRPDLIRGMRQAEYAEAKRGYNAASEGASPFTRQTRGTGNADYLRDATDQKIDELHGDNADQKKLFAVRKNLDSELPENEDTRPEATLFGDHDQSPTSIKNAHTDKMRENLGLPAASPVIRRAYGDEVMRDARSALDNNANAAEELVEKLKADPSQPITDTQAALLTMRQVDLQTQHAKVASDLIEAHNRGDEAAIVENRVREGALSDKLLEHYNVTKAAGTASARGLAARRMMMNEDYSLASMETRKRAVNDGRALTKEESEHIKELHAKIAETQAKFDDYVNKAEERLREAKSKVAADRAVREAGGMSPMRGKARVERAKAGLRQLVASFKDGLGTKFAVRGEGEPAPHEQPPETPATDWSQIKQLPQVLREIERGAIEQGITDREQRLNFVHAEALDAGLHGMERRDVMDALSGYGKFKQLSKDDIDIQMRQGHQEMQQVAKIQDMEKGLAPKKTGIERQLPTEEERRLTQQVNDLKKKLGIQTTDPETQLKSALDSTKTRLRNQIKDLEYQIATKQRIERTTKPGPRDAETAELEKQRDELQSHFDSIFGKRGLSDEQRISAATSAVEKQIADYERRIKEKDLTTGKMTSTTPETPELKAVRTRRDALKEELQLLRDNAPYIKQAKIDRDNAAQVEKLQLDISGINERIAKGEIAPKKNGTEIEDSPEVLALKKQREMLSKTLDRMRSEKDAYAIPRRIAQLQSAIDKNAQRIAVRDIVAKKADPKAPKTPEIAALEAQNERLKKTLQQLRSEATPKKTPEEIALQAFKTRTRMRMAELAEKLVRGDYGPKEPKPELKLDPQAQSLLADKERMQTAFEMNLERDRLKKRTPAQKFQDAITRWGRMSLLSGPSVVKKLSAAALARSVVTPIEEAAGAVIGKFIPGIAKAAPRQGGGFNIRAESAALSAMVKKTMPEAWKKIKTGKSDIDYLYGNKKENAVPESFVDFFGHLHSALKEPARQGEFARSFQKRTEFALRNGQDVTDPIVQMRIGTDAYKDANRAIFMQDSMAASKISNFIRAQADKNGIVSGGAKAWETVGKTVAPITKVPTNIVSETFEYAFGLVEGAHRARKAYVKGLDKLPPEQADLIMRNLKKGSLGAAALAAGFLMSGAIGGLHQKGERRDEEDVPEGSIRIAGLTMPRWMLHNPLLEILQIGATIRRVADSKEKRTDDDTRGIPAGALAATTNLVEEYPLVGDAAQFLKLFDPNQSADTAGKIIASRAVPAIVTQTAAYFDKNDKGEPIQRKPKGIVQNIESAIPYARQYVPQAAEGNIEHMDAQQAARAYNGATKDVREKVHDRIRDKIVNSKSSEVLDAHDAIAEKIKSNQIVTPQDIARADAAATANRARQDKLMSESGITPPEDLDLDREHESLAIRDKADKAKNEQLTILTNRINAADRNKDLQEKAKLKQEKQAILSLPDQLTGPSKGRFNQIEEYRRDRNAIERQLKDKAISPDVAERLLEARRSTILKPKILAKAS